MIIYRLKEDVLRLDWFKNPRPLRGRSGVYRIVDKISGELLYIGQASYLGSRLSPSTHPIYRKDIHDVYILFEDDRNERRRMEWSFIQLLKPILNIRSGFAPKDGKEEFVTEQYRQLFNN